MKYEDLTPEQLEKVHACSTPQDYIELAKSEGVELSEEQLEAVSGGAWIGGVSCPECGNADTGYDPYLREHYCPSCGHSW